MLHTILWDWNGTLLDDVEVALAAMNEMLARRGLSLLQGRKPYRDIFTFPVRVYYTAAGLDLSAEPFESLAVEWTGLYHRFYPRCGLFPAARAVLQAVGEMGLEQAIVSASHQQALDSQVEEQGLGGFFQARLGISDIYAGSKAGLAQRYLKSQGVPPEQALRHPNWDMGAKITIDSATLMNKGLEVIEASWLFDMPEEKIQVVVHRESIIHSMIQYKDHGVIAQLGLPDMAVPIQYALTYPRRLPSPAGELDLCALGALTFCPPDEEAFPCLALCREALRRGGLVPAAANGANEQAVALFLEGKIGFLDIPRLVEAAMARQAPGVVTLEAVLEADKEARAFVAGAAH